MSSDSSESPSPPATVIQDECIKDESLPNAPLHVDVDTSATSSLLVSATEPQVMENSLPEAPAESPSDVSPDSWSDVWPGPYQQPGMYTDSQAGLVKQAAELYQEWLLNEQSKAQCAANDPQSPPRFNTCATCLIRYSEGSCPNPDNATLNSFPRCTAGRNMLDCDQCMAKGLSCHDMPAMMTGNLVDLQSLLAYLSSFFIQDAAGRFENPLHTRIAISYQVSRLVKLLVNSMHLHRQTHKLSTEIQLERERYKMAVEERIQCVKKRYPFNPEVYNPGFYQLLVMCRLSRSDPDAAFWYGAVDYLRYQVQAILSLGGIWDAAGVAMLMRNFPVLPGPDTWQRPIY